MFAAAAPTLPLIREGKLRALGVTSIERLEEAPEIPPIADTIPGFNALNWTIVLAPAETPKQVVLTLHGELKAIPCTRSAQARTFRHQRRQALVERQMSINRFDVRAQIEQTTYAANNRRQRLNARKTNGGTQTQLRREMSHFHASCKSIHGDGAEVTFVPDDFHT